MIEIKMFIILRLGVVFILTSVISQSLSQTAKISANLKSELLTEPQ